MSWSDRDSGDMKRRDRLCGAWYVLFVLGSFQCFWRKDVKDLKLSSSLLLLLAVFNPEYTSMRTLDLK